MVTAPTLDTLKAQLDRVWNKHDYTKDADWFKKNIYIYDVKESQPFWDDSVNEVNLVDTKRRKNRINRLKATSLNPAILFKVSK